MFRPSLASAKLLALLLAIGLVQVVIIFGKAKIDPDAAGIAVMFSLWALLAVVNGVGIAALGALLRNRSVPRVVMIVSGTLTVAIFVAAYHYYLFSQHVTAENLAFAVQGLIHGEAGTDTKLLVVVLGGVLCVYLLVAALGYAIWRPWQAQHGRLAPALVAVVVVSLNVIGFGWRSVSHATELAYETEAYIPWVRFLPEPAPPDLVAFDPAIIRDGFFELDDLMGLDAQRQRILSGSIDAGQRPNILFVHIECLRAGVFTAENMPELFRQSGSVLQYLPAHYTTGPNTGLAINGLINGLGDTYYQAARQLWFHPLTLPVLEKLGYSISVHATRGLDYEQLGDLFFDATVDHVHVTDDGDFTLRESRMVDGYLDDLRRDSGQPRFDYLMFYATHFDYFFPDEFARYQPVSTLGFDMESGKNRERKGMREGLFNRYRNAVLYVDHLVNRIVEHLRESGQLDNTIVIIVGDHGEEFWEHGSFGHVYGLVNEQIHVPALVHFPRALPPPVAPTSHQDFFPTIFDYMQLRVPDAPCRFMTGRSLYDAAPSSDYVTASLGIKQKNLKFTEVVIGRGYKVQFEFQDRLRVTGVFDGEDRPLADFDRNAVIELVRDAFASRRGDLPGCAGMS